MSGLRRRLLGLTLSGAVIALAGGCDDDARVAATAERAAERQASQNEEVVRLNREVAEGTRRLVEADAQAREELAAAQRELHKERAEINSIATPSKKNASRWPGSGGPCRYGHRS